MNAPHPASGSSSRRTRRTGRSRSRCSRPRAAQAPLVEDGVDPGAGNRRDGAERRRGGSRRVGRRRGRAARRATRSSTRRSSAAAEARSSRPPRRMPRPTSRCCCASRAATAPPARRCTRSARSYVDEPAESVCPAWATAAQTADPGVIGSSDDDRPTRPTPSISSTAAVRRHPRRGRGGRRCAATHCTSMTGTGTSARRTVDGAVLSVDERPRTCRRRARRSMRTPARCRRAARLTAAVNAFVSTATRRPSARRSPRS